MRNTTYLFGLSLFKLFLILLIFENVYCRIFFGLVEKVFSDSGRFDSVPVSMSFGSRLFIPYELINLYVRVFFFFFSFL
jgi:hypothetical protein